MQDDCDIILCMIGARKKMVKKKGEGVGTPTCNGPLSLTTSYPSSSTWTSFSERWRLYWMRMSKSAPTNQARGFHFMGVCRHALESRSVETNMRDAGGEKRG